MKRDDCRLVILLLLAWLLVALPLQQSATAESPETRKREAFYEGFPQDQKALRKTVRLRVTGVGKQFVDASSAEACLAARRIFGRISFLFRSRDEILGLLGEPATISDYNQRPMPKDTLVYVFDSGFGGWRYTMRFRHDRCYAVEAESLN